MDSHDNSWEDFTGLTLESTQRSPSTGPVDIHAGPTPDVAPNSTEVRITSLEVTAGGYFNKEESGIGNGETESMFWDLGFQTAKMGSQGSERGCYIPSSGVCQTLSCKLLALHSI